MTKERDITLCERSLGDPTTYSRCCVEEHTKYCKNLETVIKRILSPKLEKKTMEQLWVTHPIMPTYYQLVKTHKFPTDATNGFNIQYRNEMIKTR